MSVVVSASGAPFDQGAAQGRACCDGIAQARLRLRQRCGRLGWRGALRRAHAAPSLRVRRFLPQIHERLRGIAAGAETALRVLELCESVERVEGTARCAGAVLEGRLDVPAELEPLLVLRSSAPDAVGFPSAELTCAPWAGCLAGVNDQGLGVVVVEDRGVASPSLRVYAQDLILRAGTLASSLDHLQLRARYAGGSGALLAVDRVGRALRLELCRGELRVSEAPDRGAPVGGGTSSVRVDPEARALVWRDRRGEEHVLRATAGAGGASAQG